MQQDQDMMKQNQDRRLKPMQADQSQNQHQSQQQAPQKCPRCESLNTKFCYYNNYSLSQPRYFCKTCRRYWTQGGTLRNVPVGGGCRKGKRMKTSSASTTSTASTSSSTDNSRSKTLVTSTQNVTTTSTNSGSSVSVGLRAKEEPRTLTSVAPVVYSSSDGGFFMSSLAAIQSLNNQAQSYPLNHQPVNLGRDFGSNLSLLRGFNAGVPSFGQSYHVGGRDNNSTGDLPFYATSSYHHHPQQQNWQQPAAGFISSNTNTSTGCDTALWSSSITAPTGNTDATNIENDASFPSNLADQWHHDLPGYGPSL